MQYTTVLLLALGVAGAGAEIWSLKDKTPEGLYCVLFGADAITAKLNIKNDDNITEPISFTIPKAQRVEGDCQAMYNGTVPANKLEVFFYPNGEVPAHANQDWKLTLWFTAAEGAAFKLADYTLMTAPHPLFNSTTQEFTKSDTADLDVRATGTNGFKCSTSGLALSDESTIEVKEAKVIAQARLDKPEFPETQIFEQCPLDTRTSDIVPIVVGACLAGLVAVVLVAYLVGRARAKRQGYASV